LSASLHCKGDDLQQTTTLEATEKLGRERLVDIMA